MFAVYEQSGAYGWVPSEPTNEDAALIRPRMLNSNGCAALGHRPYYSDMIAALARRASDGWLRQLPHVNAWNVR